VTALADLEWMAWTPHTAVFVGVVVVVLAGLVVLAALHPPVPRKGFLPMPTSGGDRVYVGLLGTGLSLITVIALTGLPIVVGLAVGAVWMVVVVIWG
jgi:predicted small integral membrane protein